MRLNDLKNCYHQPVGTNSENGLTQVSLPVPCTTEPSIDMLMTLPHHFKHNEKSFLANLTLKLGMDFKITANYFRQK